MCIRDRYRSCMWILHELRRDFELVLRREIVENPDRAEASAERIKRTLAALHEDRVTRRERDVRRP